MHNRSQLDIANESSIIEPMTFLSGGGKMGELIRSFEWAKTSIGNPATWPQSLRIAVRIMLDSPFGMYIAWGKEYIQLYNDGYRPILGSTKHPQALGISTRKTFAEIWPTIGPMFDGVMQGTPVGFPDFILQLDRNGYLEECVFDFSYSPIRLEDGEVGGVLVTVIETTEKVNSLKKLAESNDQLNFAIEATELGTWDYNPLTNRFTGNNRLKEWFGLPHEAQIDLSLAINMLVEKDRSRVADAIQKALQYESGGLYDIEYGIVNVITKQERIVRAKGRAWFGDDKNAYRFNGTLQDITEQATARKQIEESEAFNRSVLESSPDCLKVIDKNGRIQFMNSNGCQLMEVDNFNSIKNKYWWEMWGETNKKIVKDALSTSLQGKPAHFEAFCPTQKGTEKWWDVVVSPVTTNALGLQQIISVSRDITEQKNSEEVILKIASHLKLATDSANAGTWSLDISTQKLDWSALHKKMWGYDEHQEGLVYEDWHKLILPEDKEKAFKNIEESRIKNTPYEVEYRIERANDNVICWMKSFGQYQYNEAGEPLTLTGISIDISEQKNADEALRKNKERLQGGLNVANLLLAEINYNTGFVTLTPEAAEIYGLPADNLLVTRAQLHDTFHPEDRQRLMELISQSLHPDGNRLLETEHRILLTSKEVRWLKVNKQVFFDQDVNPSKPIYGILAVQDITAKKQIEERIKESEAKFRVLSESIPHMIWTATPDGKKNFFNQYFIDYTGLSFEELKGDGWQKTIFPGDLEKELQRWHHTLGTGEDFIIEKRLRCKDGTYRWHLCHSIAQKDKQGGIIGWIGTNTEIEEQKIIELKKDEFISIASHEMKTPLTTAKGYLELLSLSLSEENQYALYATKATQAVQRLQDLVTELLDASKIQNGQLNYNITTFDFNKMLDEAIENIQQTAKNHTIHKTGKILTAIKGDKERLQQVLINLLTNAIKYSPNADKVLLKIDEQPGSIQVSVHDFGVGIAGHHLDKIFDRYYRVQEHAIHFQGLGIGLYISSNIIQRHEGKMWAESVPEKGSTFYFTLPI